MPSDGSHPDSRAISEKEEIARAALRSLAQSPAGPSVNQSTSASSQLDSELSHAGPSKLPSSLSESTDSHFFDDQHLTSSPVSSPRLLPSAETDVHALRAQSSDISQRHHVQESAIRRVSLLFRMSIEEVRRILQQVRPARSFTMPDSSLQGSAAYLSTNKSEQYQRVIDAYTQEIRDSSKQSLGLSSDDSGLARNMSDVVDQSHATHQQAHDEVLRSRRPLPQTYSAISNMASYRYPDRPVSLSGLNSAHHGEGRSGPAQRPPSPSPFAFDPYRRPSQPVAQGMHPPPEHLRGYNRFSLDSGRSQPTLGRESPTAAHATDGRVLSFYPRKGRSIDDYLQHHSGPITDLPLRPGISSAPGIADARVSVQDNRTRDEHSIYPAHQTYSTSAASSDFPIASSSATDASRSALFRHRSPGQGSTAHPSSKFTTSPSPLLESSGTQHAQARGGSVESLDEAAPSRVSRLRIDDKPRPAPFMDQLRSARSSSNVSVKPAASEVSHTEVMRRLQHRVKSRLAAKSRGEQLDLGLPRAGTDKSKGGRAGTPSKRASSVKPSEAEITESARESAGANANPASGSNKARKLTKASTSAPTASTGPARSETPNSIAAALLSPTDTPTPSEAARNLTSAQTSSSSDNTPIVETASGQALPGEIPAAGQMNASSAAKQQTSMAGIDSLLQAAAASDPTEKGKGHAIA